MRIVVLAGGIGGARFVRGLRAAAPDADITVVGNTGDDITLFGLRICPDLDTIMYTLGGGIAEDRGWGRADERFVVQGELAAYGAQPQWFGLGDRDIATHVLRTARLAAGEPLGVVTEALCARWGLPERRIRLLPMSEQPVETHLVIGEADGARRSVHFQEYWVGRRAEPPVYEIVAVGAADSRPAPGVVEAIAAADVVLLAPSNPVVSIGTILAVPGVRDALRRTAAPVVGLSPIVGGAPVRGMADRLLPVLGVAVSAAGVAEHYGARRDGGLLDGWLVDERDAGAVGAVAALGIECRAVPLLMSDVRATAEMAAAALALRTRAPAR